MVRRQARICLFLTAGGLAAVLGGCAAIPEASVPSLVGITASPVEPTPPPSAAPTQVHPTDPAQEQPALQITYICNDGFLISTSGKRILVDALFNDADKICPANLEVATRAAADALGGAQLVLVSHSHWDHFDPHVVGSYLLSNPDSVLIAEHSAAEALAAEFEDFPDIQDRVHGLEVDRGQATQMSVSGIEVEVISAPADVPNLGFIVRVGGAMFLHSGDSGYDSTMAADFRALALADRDIDLAFLPYWYFIDPSGESMVAEVPARYYIPMHYAGEQLSAVFPAVKDLYPHAILFGRALEIWPP
jgi:L-ascorbate metabolism protein UlaG (beta-lactamase superfamily)